MKYFPQVQSPSLVTPSRPLLSRPPRPNLCVPASRPSLPISLLNSYLKTPLRVLKRPPDSRNVQLEPESTNPAWSTCAAGWLSKALRRVPPSGGSRTLGWPLRFTKTVQLRSTHGIRPVPPVIEKPPFHRKPCPSPPADVISIRRLDPDFRGEGINNRNSPTTGRTSGLCQREAKSQGCPGADYR